MEEIDEQNDPFRCHFEGELTDGLLSALTSQPAKYDVVKRTWPTLKNLYIQLPRVERKCHDDARRLIDEAKSYVKTPDEPIRIDTFSADRFYIKGQIKNNISSASLTYNGETELNSLQLELLSIFHQYKDTYYTERNFDNCEQIRFVYCLHAINHVLKARSNVIRHNERIKRGTAGEEEFRDQGVVRPKVLLLIPFRNSAFRIVNMISSILLSDEKPNVVNKKRFCDEFGGQGVSESMKKNRPEDYVKTFDGNIDDNFKIGIHVAKKSMKLYADFYSSDIIIASPLGLRMLIGAEGEQDRDYDFLSSIEVFIMDQTEIFLMQNWDHVLHVIEHTNLQPTESHDADFARVRPWALNGWTKFYRQTIVVSSHPLLPISALFNQRCCNYGGKVRINNPIAVGTISQVVVHIPQMFHRLKDTTASESVDARFEAFTSKILPRCRDNLTTNVLVYVPSYFDFVRLRNYFKAEAISFTPVCEYTEDGKVAESRYLFFHQEANYMLYSERFHFFMRRKIKGIRHLIFYQLPTFPHFYSEMCNLLQETEKSDSEGCSVTVLYCKYDAPQLAGIVSADRAARMLLSKRDTHMFVTDDS